MSCNGAYIRDYGKWDSRFMAMAQLVATWSKDPSTKVGAVIVDVNRRIVSIGYNGFPRRVNDSELRYNDREQKYPRIVHAEVNAVLNANKPLEYSTIFTTLAPCPECAKVLIQVGIFEVISPPCEDERWLEKTHFAAEMMREAGLLVSLHT